MVSSCSMSLISFDSACSLRRRSATAMGFPARHDNGSLNLRPCRGSMPLGRVVDEVAVVEGIVARYLGHRWFWWYFLSIVRQHWQGIDRMRPNSKS